jgi:hypothetical protein
MQRTITRKNERYGLVKRAALKYMAGGHDYVLSMPKNRDASSSVYVLAYLTENNANWVPGDTMFEGVTCLIKHVLEQSRIFRAHSFLQQKPRLAAGLRSCSQLTTQDSGLT